MFSKQKLKSMIAYMHIGKTVFAVVLVCAYAIALSLFNWAPGTAEAAIPKYINFQGKLTQVSNGNNVANGNYAFRFKIYDASTSGTLLWTETFDQPSGACGKLAVTNGVFNAKLGTCGSPDLLSALDFTGGSLYLSVDFAPTGTSYDGEMSPRKQLVSSAYAFVANGVSGDGKVNVTPGQSTTALTVARSGTDYALQVDTNTASSATGLKVTAAAAGNGLALATISSGTNENLTLDAKGSGTVSIGATSTGDVLFGGGSASTGCTVTNSNGNFTCTATIQGATLNGTSAIQLGGTDINTAGTLTNVAYENQANVFTLANTFQSDVDLTFADSENLSMTSTITGTTSVDLFAATVANQTSSGTQRGIVLTNANDAANAVTENLILIDNAETTASTLTDAILITSSGVNGGVVDAIDASASNIDNAINIGANAIAGTNFNVSAAGAVVGVGVNAGSGLLQGTGGLTITGTTNINATGTSATNIGNSTGVLTIASGGASSWTNTSGTLALATTTSGNITATTATTSGIFNILTGSLKVGNGTPDTTQDGEDAYIEGTVEIDTLGGGGTVCVTASNTGVLGTTSCSGSVTLQNAYTGGNTISTTSGNNIAITLAEVVTPTSFTIENQDTAGVSAERIFNSIASGTLTNGLLIEQTGAGTMTNAIQIAETAGTITDGILITGTLGNILNSGSIDITGAGAITGATGISSSGTIAFSGLSTNGAVYTSGGTGTLNSEVNLDVTRGGTGVGTFTTNGVLYGNSTSDILVTAQGGANTVLVANAGAPSFSAAITVGTSVTSPTINASTVLQLGGTDINTAGTLTNVAYENQANTFTLANIFQSDVDLTLADTENLTLTNTVTSTNSVDLFSTTLTNQTSSGTQRGIVLTNANDAANAVTENLILIDNAETTASTLTDAILITSSGVNDGITDAIDASASNITNAINIGANAIAGTNFNVSAAGAVVGVGVNAGAGLLQGQLGLTITGAAVSLNDSSNFAVNIATGSNNALTTIGGGSGTFSLQTTNIDISSAGAITGATGVTSSGTITFSGLTADRLVTTTTGGQLTTSISSANLALSVSDETGSGLVVLNNSPLFVDDITIGSAGTATGQILLAGTTSGTVTIQPQAAAGTYNFNLPTTAGSSGYVLTSAGGGASPMTWTDPSGLGVRWNAIINPTGTQSLTFDDGELNAWTVSSDTETFQTITGNSLTTGTLLSTSSTALTTGKVIDINLGSSLTTGSAINITGASYNHPGSQIGSVISVAYTDASTNTGSSGSETYGILLSPTFNSSTAGGHYMAGLRVNPTFTNCTSTALFCLYDGALSITGGYTQTVASTFNINAYRVTSSSLVQNTAAGTITWDGMDIANPNITQTTGTVTANGLLVTTGSITTGGTQTGLNIAATGVGAGTLNGVNISSITGSSGTETALMIGSGWDAGINNSSIYTGTVQSATALTVARTGTDYALQVDTNTASSATGLKITSAAAAGGVALATISSGTNEFMTIDAKGSGEVRIGGSSTGNILLGGGSSSTGCTVTNSSGAFACTAGGSFTTGTFNPTGAGNVSITNSTASGTAGALLMTVTSSSNFVPAASISMTQTATGSLTASYGLQNTVFSGAVVTGGGVGQTLYGNYTAVDKSGADTATGTYTIYGDYITTSNLGRTDTGTVNTYGSRIIVAGDTAGTSTTYGLHIAASGADSNYAIVTNGGNVGIGDTSPSSLFTVGSGDLFQVASNGNLTSSNAGTWTFSNDTNIVLSGGVNGLSFDTDVLSIDATNNRVGVGLTSPLATFHVYDTIQVGSNGASNGFIRSPNNLGFTLDTDNDQSGTYFSWENHAVTIGTGTELMRLQEDGKLGIGDASPNSLFTVGSGDLFQINSTGQIGSQQAPVSDYLFALAGTTGNDHSRIIDITQANDAAEDSKVISIVNTAVPSTINGTTRENYNIFGSYTPSTTLSSISGAGQLDFFGSRQNISLGSVTLGNTDSTLNTTLQTYGHSSSITVSPTINDTDGSGGIFIRNYGTDSSLSGSPVYTNVANFANIETTAGYFNNGSASPGHANVTYNSYGVYASAGGNLTTTGTTTHYGGYFTSGGTADINYGIYATVAGATTNYAAILTGGNVGIGTSAPDRALEINNSSGNNLRLTYNDSDGSATNYADLLTTSAGALTIQPSGFIANLGGGATRTALRFLEPSGTGTDYAAIQSNANVTTSYTWTLPAADASGCIQSNGSGALSISACGGSSALDGLTAATTDDAAILSGDNTIEWSWALTSAASKAFTISESAASTGGSGNQHLLRIATASTSTAGPLEITSNSADGGDIEFNLASAGDFEIQDAGTPFVTFTDGGIVQIASANATGTTTSSSLSLAANSLTTGTGLYLASSSLSSGSMIDIAVTGTAALTNQKGINVSLSGANASGSQTTYGGYFSNTHTGSGTNIGLYATASGGSNNYAAILDAGSVGIGTTGPDRKLDILDASAAQLRLTYSDGSMYTDFRTDSSGRLGIVPVGANTGINVNASGVTALDIAGSTTAASGTGQGVYIYPTVTSAGNSDTLYGVRIDPTFSNGGAHASLSAVGLSMVIPTYSGTIATTKTIHAPISNSGTTANYGIMVAGSPTSATGVGIDVTNSGAVSGTGYGIRTTKSGAATTNIALYATASGGTNNYSGIFDAGSVGIGTTGPDRKLDVLDASNPQLRLTQADGSVYADLQSTTSANLILTGDSLTASSGLEYGMRITPTVNQTSSASYRALDVNVTETAATALTGLNRLLDLRVSDSSKLAVSNNGSLTLQNASSLTTAYGGFGSYQNHLVRSEAFDNASWTKTSVTAPTADTQTAPDGSATAESLATSGSGGDVCQFTSTAPSSDTFTFSVWVRSTSGTQNFDMRIDAGATSCATANSTTGTAVTHTATTSWQRFSVTQTFSGASNFVKVRIFPGGTGGTGTVYAWGAQLDKASVPSTYAKTTTATLTNDSRGLIVNNNLKNTTASGFLYGGRQINIIDSTTAGTHIGQFIRMLDNTSLDSGQVVRGLEVQAFSGTNVNGTNTGIASYGYTYGIQAVTTSQAAAQAIPAAVFADLDNGTDATTKTRGNAIRAYTNDATSADMLYIYQETSAYTGNALLMDLGNGGGSFASGNFINLKNAGTSKFTAASTGRVDLFAADADNIINFYINTEESTVSQSVWALESDTTGNGQTADTVKAHFEADGSLFVSLTGTQTTNALCHTGAGQTNNDEIVDCSGAPSDVAEYFGSEDPTLTAGELVVVGKAAQQMHLDGYHTSKAWVARSTSAYQPSLMGVVSTAPAVAYGDEIFAPHENPRPIALAGRVPVKVTTENGPILPGDFLTASSTPGAAMKATKAGPVIGQALEGYAGPAGQIGSVIVFVKAANYNGVAINEQLTSLSFDYSDAQKSAWNSAKILEHLVSQLATLDESNLSQINTDVVVAGAEVVTPTVTTQTLRADFISSATAEGGLAVSSVAIFNGGLLVDSIGSIGGLLSFTGDVEFFGTPYFTSDTAGFAVVKAGVQTVDIKFSREYLAQPIVNASYTFEQDADTTGLDQQALAALQAAQIANTQAFLAEGITYAITNKSKSGFTIVLSKPSVIDIKFSWTALAVRNASTFMSLDPVQNTQAAGGNDNGAVLGEQNNADGQNGGGTAGDASGLVNDSGQSAYVPPDQS